MNSDSHFYEVLPEDSRRAFPMKSTSKPNGEKSYQSAMRGLVLPVKGLDTLRAVPTWALPPPEGEAGEKARPKSLALASS